MAPASAANKAGIPNWVTTFQLVCFAINPNLKILLAKCTTAVAVIVNETGKIL